MPRPSSSIRVVRSPDGVPTYVVHACPESLPPVRSADLADAWAAARAAACDGAWDRPRLFRFIRPDGMTTDLALADADACCWAGAVDAAAGIGTLYGLSLCLRLLALVDLLARAPWTGPLCHIRRGGAVLDPGLIRVAAVTPLTRDAAFDETVFRHRLGVNAPHAIARLAASGASA